MLRKPLFWETFILLAMVGVLDRLANVFDLYWKVSELDSLAHFLGGAFAASIILWLYFFSGIFVPSKRNFGRFLLISILAVTLIAVLWEIYELILGEAKFNESQYAYDTTLDFVMDFLGAFALCLYAYLRELEYKASKIII